MAEEAAKAGAPAELVRLTAEIVSGYVAGNSAGAEKVAPLIGEVHRALSELTSPRPTAPNRPQRPAVPISRSVQPDYIVCLEDGRQLKMLKRYLRARYQMSPDEYRRKWGLPADYPLVAPNYAARRSQFAKEIGLGRRPARRRA
ncbi:MAG: MucR family transcriptional regulator [Caulobacteraceae bacterium]